MSEKDSLEQTIALLEGQRAVLGDAVVEAALAPLRAQLAALGDALRTASGERKFVTVMFADIAGFTALAETLDPEAARDLMNACFDCLVPVIQEYGGVVDKFIGDGVMALFGAPLAHENDPERALRAALAMRAALRDFNATQGLDLALHFGINTGLVIAGGLGAQGRQEYSVMGDAVNVAARLENVSRPGEILVGPTTHRFTAPLFDFDALPPVSLKGKREPLLAYRVRDLKAERGSLRGIVGMRAPLVGRAEPYTALQTALTRLESGRGGTISLIGEAGLGKSRLLAEIRQQAPAHFLWLEGHCLSFGASIAYWPWLDILRTLAGVTPDAPSAELHAALHARLAQVCAERSASIYPYLARLLSLPLEEAVAAKVRGLDGETLKSATFQAIETLCTCLCTHQPVVIVGEDLHWGDPTSLALFERLLPLTHNAPLLLIGVLRPEHAHACWRFHEAASQNCSAHITLALEPLDAAQSAELVGHLLRVEDLPSTLRDKILRHAEGNPFYVEEIIRSLLDAEAIAYNEETGAWRATRDVATIEVPDTLQGVLMARIDRLQQETKHVLRLAAVIGRAFLYRVLAEIAHEERALDTRLGELVQEQMIRERARDPELEYIFKHQLTQEAAYNGLLLQERRIYHRQVAEAIERLFPNRSDELAGLLAHHWEQAGDTEHALPALLRAGQLDAAQFANLEAIDYFTRALTLAPEEDAEIRYALLTARETCYDIIGEREAQRRDLDMLAELAQGAHRGAWLANVAVRQANYHWQTSDYPQAVSAAQAAVRLGEDHHLPAAQAQGYFTWGRVELWQKQYETAQTLLERALPFSREAGSQWLEGMILRNIGNAHCFHNRNDVGEPYILQALEIHRALNDRRSEAAALNTLGLIRKGQHNLRDALHYLQEAFRVFQETGEVFGMMMLHYNLQELYQDLYDYPRARAEIERGLQLCARTGNQAVKIDLQCRAADIDFKEAHLNAAQNTFATTLEQARALNLPARIATALAGLGRIAMLQGQYTAARCHFEEMLSLIQQAQDPERIARMHSLMAFLLYLQGQYTRAETQYRELITNPQLQNSAAGVLWELHTLALIAYQQGRYAAAREYAEQALALARQWGEHECSTQSMILTTLGHILAAEGQADEAETAYREAFELRRDLTWHPHRVLEIHAGLARLALARGDLLQAQAEIALVLPTLAQGPPAHTDDLFAIYLTAYRVLTAAAAPRATELLATAHALLQERAAAIEDAEQRRSYLENVAAHRELIVAYQESQTSDFSDATGYR